MRCYIFKLLKLPNVDLGLVLISRKLFVTQKENNNANFISIFESQTVSWQLTQVPSQHLTFAWGGGGGCGGSSDCQGMWPLIFQSLFKAKQNFLIRPNRHFKKIGPFSTEPLRAYCTYHQCKIFQMSFFQKVLTKKQK